MVDWERMGCLWNDEGTCYYPEESLGWGDGKSDLGSAELGHGDHVDKSESPCEFILLVVLECADSRPITTY